MYFSGKTVEESARKPFGLNRRHETGVLRLPQRRHDKVGLPPSAPAFQRANRNPQFLSKPRRRWYLPGMPGRYQHHQQPKIHAPTKKSHRQRGAPPAAPIAAEAQTLAVVLSNFCRAASRLARIIGNMEFSSTVQTSLGARLLRQFVIDPFQMFKKPGGLQ